MIGRTNADYTGTVVLTVTLSRAVSGASVTATNSYKTYAKTTNASGVATMRVRPGLSYTVSAMGRSEVVYVGSQGASVYLDVVFIWGCDIAIATADPWARVTYPSDVENFGYTPATGHDVKGWADSTLINDIAPVRIANGVKTYLDKRDPTKTADGSASNITIAGNDAFAEFPLKWLSITSDANYVHIRFSNFQVDSTYQCYAHRFDGQNQSAFYYGMFLAERRTINGTTGLYSIGGGRPTTNEAYGDFISYAHNRGAGYDIATFYQTMYIEALLILLYKTTDIQGSSDSRHGLAYGRDDLAISSVISYDNDYGMAGTKQSDSPRMSAFWVNDFYGNCNSAIGCAFGPNPLKTIVDGLSTTDTSLFEKSIDTGISTPLSGWVTGVVGTTDAGLLPNQASGGSSSTYWADYCNYYAGRFPYFGGKGGNTWRGFYWQFDICGNGYSQYVSSRLSYRIGLMS